MAESDWRSEIKEQLQRLDSPLKQSSVIAYIEQKIKGQSYDTFLFWQRNDTCARSTWNKWKKDDPVFNDVLAATWSIATDFRATGAADALTEAVLTLQLNAPDFAKSVVDLAVGDGVKDDVKLRAALAGLDRASAMTAPKSEVFIPGLDDALDRIWGNDGSDDDDDNAP